MGGSRADGGGPDADPGRIARRRGVGGTARRPWEDRRPVQRHEGPSLCQGRRRRDHGRRPCRPAGQTLSALAAPAARVGGREGEKGGGGVLMAELRLSRSEGRCPRPPAGTGSSSFTEDVSTHGAWRVGGQGQHRAR